jgi:DNA-binding MarR family transcriptional regulator
MPDMECSQTGPSGVAFLLAQIGAQGAAKFAERLESLKLSPPQAGIIGLIGKRSGLSQQALANLLGMFPSRLVLMLDELERSGLIERRANAGDRRTYSLYLTASGTKILPAIGRIARTMKPCAQLSTKMSEKRSRDFYPVSRRSRNLNPAFILAIGDSEGRRKNANSRFSPYLSRSDAGSR